MDLDILRKQLEMAKENYESYDQAYYDLERFYENKDKINKILTFDISDDSRSFLYNTSQLMSQIEDQLKAIYDELENKKNDLTEQYAKAKHSITINDIIDYVDLKGNQCALRVERIHYNANDSLYIMGTKVLKSGKIGKMHGFFTAESSKWQKRTKS